MKKIIALAIAIVMMAALAVPAFATNVTTEGTEGAQGTVVSYTVDDSFTVVIPETATFEDQNASIALSASGTLDIGATLSVAIDSENTTDSDPETDPAKDTWNLVNGTEKVAYTIKNGVTPVLPGDTVITYEAGAATSNVTLSLNVPVAPTKAATYTDTLTFTATVTPAAQG